MTFASLTELAILIIDLHDIRCLQTPPPLTCASLSLCYTYRRTCTACDSFRPLFATLQPSLSLSFHYPSSARLESFALLRKEQEREGLQS